MRSRYAVCDPARSTDRVCVERPDGPVLDRASAPGHDPPELAAGGRFAGKRQPRVAAIHYHRLGARCRCNHRNRSRRGARLGLCRRGRRSGLCGRRRARGRAAHVAALFGAQFANAGFHLEVSTLAPGAYTLVVYGRSTVTGAFSVEQHVRVTVPERQALSWIDAPAANATVGSSFFVSGWAVEFNAAAGTGVDMIHIWATSSSGVATFLGAATYGANRPDVGAWLGPRYSASGYWLAASLPPGSYTLSVYPRSTETGTFRNWRTVEITVQ